MQYPLHVFMIFIRINIKEAHIKIQIRQIYILTGIFINQSPDFPEQLKIFRMPVTKIRFYPADLICGIDKTVMGI